MPVIPYILRTNQILRDRNLRPSGICQCCKKYLGHYILIITMGRYWKVGGVRIFHTPSDWGRGSHSFHIPLDSRAWVIGSHRFHTHSYTVRVNSSCKLSNHKHDNQILPPCYYCHHPWCVGDKSYHKASLIMFSCDGISDYASWNEVFQ